MLPAAMAVEPDAARMRPVADIALPVRDTAARGMAVARDKETFAVQAVAAVSAV